MDAKRGGKPPSQILWSGPIWRVPLEIDSNEGAGVDLAHGGENKNASSPCKGKPQQQKGWERGKEEGVFVRVCWHLDMEGGVCLISEPTNGRADICNTQQGAGEYKTKGRCTVGQARANATQSAEGKTKNNTCTSQGWQLARAIQYDSG